MNRLEIKSTETSERRVTSKRDGKEMVFVEQQGLLHTEDGEVRSCKFNPPRDANKTSRPLAVGTYEIVPSYVDRYNSLCAADPIRSAKLITTPARKSA